MRVYFYFILFGFLFILLYLDDNLSTMVVDSINSSSLFSWLHTKRTCSDDHVSLPNNLTNLLCTKYDTIMCNKNRKNLTRNHDFELEYYNVYT